MSKMLRILLLGKSARLDAMAEALWVSPRCEGLYILAEVNNPGLRSHATEVVVGDSSNPTLVVEYARKVRPDFAVIGPEEPLAEGVVDALAEIGIPCVGPTRLLAQIETSKSFARDLIARHGISGNPEYQAFSDSTGLNAYLCGIGKFVVKPDGLTGGKGVRVWGDHFNSLEEGESYCREVFESGGSVVIEEKLEGEEFSFQSFCDGYTVVDTIPVQDHKRQGIGDTGPNTGGMGSYTCEDHSLPFLTKDDLAQASRINKAVADALRKETGVPYKGILYGGFMVTRRGLRVIEYNARLGDPEALNILPILETSFLDICEAIVSGTLDTLDVKFSHKATVCKYVVPEGYPDHPVKGCVIDLPTLSRPGLRIYQGAVQDSDGGQIELTGSRAIGVVGIGNTLAEAEQIAEDAASSISGPVFHRSDIGTSALVGRRIAHMRQIRQTSVARTTRSYPEPMLHAVAN